MTGSIPKAVLYYNPNSLWSTAALFAFGKRSAQLLFFDALYREEKGYSQEEVERKIVDLSKGENLSLSFLRLNPKGTVPTLIVPLEKTLAPEDEHRFKAVTDTKSVIEFLDKSRSATSRTHTVSTAPAPALTPATIALSSTSNTIIDLIHADDDTPLMFFSATTLPALQTLSQKIVPFLHGRVEALNGYITSSQAAEIQASEKTRRLWEGKKALAENLFTVYSSAGKDDAQLSPEEKAARDAYLKKTQEIWQVKVRKVLVTLDKEMVGPFALGDQISVADLHLAPWLARVALLCGATATDAGDVVVAKIEQRIGDNFVLPKDFQVVNPPDVTADPTLAATPGAKKAKLAAFWDEMRARPSWKKVYDDKLH